MILDPMLPGDTCTGCCRVVIKIEWCELSGYPLGYTVNGVFWWLVWNPRTKRHERSDGNHPWGMGSELHSS
jgi:hypothetical protein